MDQSVYIQKILQRFEMSDCNPASTPMDVNVKLSRMQSQENIIEN